MSSSFLVVHGQVQAADGVIHLVAERFTDLSQKLGVMRDEEGVREDPPPQVHNRVTGRLIRSRDFH
jgi:error-prone DNA polymerase